jgi:predicted PhzF superfamily epimerase YddE/YHI9
LRRSGPLSEADVVLIARGLGVARSDILHHAWCDNGPGWRSVMLGSAAQVLALRPDAQVLQGLDIGVVGPRGKVGVVAAHEGGDAQFEVRAFFPTQNGLSEDPVTGSLNAALGQWLIGAGLGRAGRVHVQRDADGQVWVGGDTVTCISGQVRL